MAKSKKIIGKKAKKLRASKTPASRRGGCPDDSPATFEAELKNKLNRAYSDMSNAKNDYDEKKEELKVARAALENRQAVVMHFVRQIVGAEKIETPLFDQANQDAGGDPDEDGQDDHDIEESKAGEDEDDSWRDKSLMGLLKENGRHEIDDRYIKAMAENSPSITTLGELADWQKKKGDFWAQDIKGLGQAGRGQIETALENFWAQRRQMDNPSGAEAELQEAAAS